jgi:glycolate oxidase FAD binding subunit
MSLAAFESVLGAEHVQTIDGERLDGVPVIGEIRPGTPEEVAGCLQVAAAEAQAVLVCGGGSKLGWGNAADTPTLVRLLLTRLDHPLELDAAEGVAVVGPGVSLVRLRDEAAAAGKRVLLGAPHPGATVGGSVAADAFCAAVHPSHRLRDEILGLQVALPSGSLARAGGRVVKNVTGYDLVRLHCGAYGTLGVITEVTLRLRPISEQRWVVTRRVSSSAEACRLAGELSESRVEPTAAAVRTREGEGLLVWILEGSEADVRARAERFEGERAEPTLWEEIEGSLASVPTPGHARLRVLGRPSDTEARWLWLESVGGKPALALPLVGLVFGDLAEEAVPEAVGAARESGTAVFVEHASPALKGRVDVFGSAPDTMPLMRVLKARFDPNRVLAPGRFVGRI